MTMFTQGDKSGRGGRLWRAAALGLLAANLGNVVLGRLAVGTSAVPASFPPVQVGPVLVFTTAGVIGAALVCALVARFARRPVSTFRRVALIALLVSLLPDLALLRTSPFPDTTLPGVLTLMAMHVLAWAVCASVLPSSLGALRRA